MTQERNFTLSSKDFFKYPTSKQHMNQQNDIPVSDSRRYLEYIVDIFPQSTNYAIGMIDMVNSTKITAQIGPIKTARYFQVFLNSMSKILSRYGGTVFKIGGDSLLFHFTDSDPGKTGLVSCIECSLEMIRSQKYISQQLVSEGLPIIDFRVSADYGPVLLVKTSISEEFDMIGPPVNMCAKINRLAENNQLVIGGDLFQMVKHFKVYQFKEINDFSLGFKLSYPVYLVADK